MYLKALEVSNFKSFRGEVTIPLERGFTAITGPNGSGKSNCGDAIQFVLGPRSNKTIRAQNSKDLIFNGGNNHNAARSCSVTLVFANPSLDNGRRRLPLNMDEVRMSRSIRLTKSGNVVTNYHLNGEESSQKSFHRILGAANARPDGYNIVLQGDVTSLAKMTAKERRKVLDSVAGVTLYDDEIRKADRQKDSVDDYIERIKLLEDSQKIRLKELKKQKDLAVKVKDLVEDLNQARITSYQASYASQLAEKEYQVNEQSRYLEEANNLEQQVREGSKTLLSLDDQIGELQKQIEELTGGESKGLNKVIFDLHLRIDTNKDKISEAESKDLDDKAEVEELSSHLDGAKSALEEFVNNLNTAKQDLEDSKKSLDEAQTEELEIQKIMESSGDESAKFSQQLTSLLSELEQATEKLNLAQSEVNKTAVQAELISEQLAKSQETAEENRLALGELELQGQELSGNNPSTDRNKLSKDLITAQRSEEKLVEQSQLVEVKLREAERTRERLRAEMENSSGAKGMAGGAAAVISARDNGELTGIIGTIAELCAPIDSSHESALATAIGGGMTSIVVENDEIAAKAIKWLAEKRAGRATFLPLNKLNNNRAAGKALMVSKKPGVVGFAHELLDYDPKIDIAIKFVLRNTLIVDSLSTARNYMGGVRLVTLRGDVTEAGGAMIGGSKRPMRVSFGGGIKGASEIEKLSSEIAKLELMSETVSAALHQARKEQQQLRTKINELTDSDQAVKLQEWRAEIKQAKSVYNKSLGEVNGHETKLSDLEMLASKQIDSLDEAQSMVADLNEKVSDTRNEMEAASPEHLKDRLHAAQMKRLDSEGLMSKALAALESGSEHETLLTERVTDLTSRIESLNSSIISRSDMIDNLQASIATDSIELKDREEERTQLLEENKGLEDERLVLVDERASLRTELTQKSTDAQSRRRLSDELGRSIINKEMVINELYSDMQANDISPAPPEVSLPSVGDAEKRVRSLERAMEKHGPVNMLAIEQYAECEERLDSMKVEFKQLQSRRANLVEITEKLESQRKQKLVKVLDKVNENFQKSYKILSDGGKGELYLENPDEPFKGGLELWAKPKGKSSKVNRLQLSGGEQSMAALALIFAIQDYDPSPFYYFDEVDQNLDAINAERIAEMCRERSKKAQFLMVTLRKVSLRLADHHIGITHGGDGCSRRIVDFDRERAIKLSEIESAKDNPLDERISAIALEKQQDAQADMPTVPEPLPPPKSLGGLLNFTEEIAEEETTISGLMERASETSEDIQERREVSDAISSIEEKLEQTAPTEHIEEEI
ncbi:MAG: chromosome segregation protein SMC [Candidatus Poseidoniaceae archaeon]